MKFQTERKKRATRRWDDRTRTTNVPSPFFPKQFAGFAYVERRKQKPGPGEQGVFRN